jgi:hypothetical protein
VLAPDSSSEEGKLTPLESMTALAERHQIYRSREPDSIAQTSQLSISS